PAGPCSGRRFRKAARIDAEPVPDGAAKLAEGRRLGRRQALIAQEIHELGGARNRYSTRVARQVAQVPSSELQEDDHCRRSGGEEEQEEQQARGSLLRLGRDAAADAKGKVARRARIPAARIVRDDSPAAVGAEHLSALDDSREQ